MEHPSPFWAATALATFVREQASWRRAQARKFPDDPRNAKSAAALDELASKIEQLPDSDPSLNELVDLQAFDADERFVDSAESRRSVSRVGFDQNYLRPRDVLHDLVAITRRLRRSPAPERNSQVTLMKESHVVEWVRDRYTHPKHAIRERFGEDQARAYCGAVLDLGGDSEELRARAPIEGACALCEELVRRDDEPETLVEREQALVGEILDLAATYDSRVDGLRRAIWHLNGIGGGHKQRREFTMTIDAQQLLEDLLCEHQSAVANLCARLAAAAAAHARPIAIYTRNQPLETVLSGLTFKTPEGVELLGPIFASAGIQERLMSKDEYEQQGREPDLATAVLESDAELVDDLMTVGQRRELAQTLRAVQKALRLVRAGASESELTEPERLLREALTVAGSVKAYRLRLEDARMAVKAMSRTRGGTEDLMLRVRAHSAIATVLENLKV